MKKIYLSLIIFSILGAESFGAGNDSNHLQHADIEAAPNNDIYGTEAVLEKIWEIIDESPEGYLIQLTQQQAAELITLALDEMDSMINDDFVPFANLTYSTVHQLSLIGEDNKATWVNNLTIDQKEEFLETLRSALVQHYTNDGNSDAEDFENRQFSIIL